MKKALILLGIGVLVLSVTQMASAAILNGNFEAPDVLNTSPGFVTYATAPSGFGWVIDASAGQLKVDHINSLWSGVSGTTNPDGYDQSVDIDFETLIYQSFATIPGQRYLLSFAYANNPDRSSSRGGFGVLDTPVFLAGSSDYDYDDADFLLNGDVIHNTSTFASMNFTRYNGRFSAVSNSTTLGFIGDPGNEYWGFVVDDVKVFPVPEPATLTLLGLGLLGALGLAGFKRKR